MAQDVNYFVCTLSEAAQSSRKRPYNTVNQLIRRQANQYPNLPAVGLFNLSADSRDSPLRAKVFTFKDVENAVSATASLLSKTLQARSSESVGLLSASSPAFLFTWLACIWLGHPVLLIAPECSAGGIANLCFDCKVSILITDERHERLGQQASKQDVDGRPINISCLHHPFWMQNIYEVLDSTAHRIDPVDPVEASTTAYFHHTSGTSSGIPKPVPQSHHGAVGVLPALDGQRHASFTTTPLYHGGPADTFRAWTSNAIIWLYPSQDLPITSTNVVRCLESADRESMKMPCPPITYFGAVPYVLQTMSEDKSALQWLRKMELVSVGGAALPEDLGNRLVREGVNLVSRFGSAECGFLLSSHRDYLQDQEWQYLRHPNDADLVRFEYREDNLFELVVSSDWPHLAKRNREDGSYTTSDLFQRHHTISNGWKYHSRADARLTLATGLKFDPASLEGPIAAASPLLSEVLVFGNQQPYPGALLFRSKQAESLSDSELIDQCAAVVEKCCSNGLSQAKLQRNMLVPMPYSDQPLPKSSKGTILRGKAGERYRAAIDGSYTQDDAAVETSCSDDELPAVVQKVVARFLQTELAVDIDADLFGMGVNSMASIQIRKNLQRLLPDAVPPLPTTIVEDCGTIKRLSDRLLDIRNGRQSESNVSDHESMQRLLEKYSEFSGAKPDGVTNGHTCTQRKVVVLTGATGALGSHVLDLLQQDQSVAKVYCLVRGASTEAARERVRNALSQRQLSSLASDDRVEIIVSKLSDHRLGLDDTTYDRLGSEATVVMHLAWSVNFRMKLKNFEKDIAGVQALIRLAMSSVQAARFLFCSSVASAMAVVDAPVPESILDDPACASGLGYSQSKWVAEQVCNRSNKHEQMRGKVALVRVGQLSGNSKSGVWNMNEAWPLMLSTVNLVGCLPNLEHEVLDWLPVDTAAFAMIQAADLPTTNDGDLRVFHVLNTHREPTWDQMLIWLQRKIKFDIVSPLDWVARLEAAAAGRSNHPALGLADHWKTAVSKGNGKRTTFDVTRTEASIPSLRCLPAVYEGYFARLWDWISSQAIDQ